MAIYALGDLIPQIDDSAYVHPDAVVIGDVRIGAEATIWPTAVLRGDYGTITVGPRTSIQDGSIIHATAVKPTIIGADCVVGHNVHLEGCIIEDRVLVGSGCVALHDVHVESGAVIGAGAVCPDGLRVPGGAMALGVPAKVREGLVQRDYTTDAAALYVANGKRYAAELRRLD